MKAVIMAAGYGSRFFPITKTIAKEMLPIIDKPAIHFIIDELLSAGIQDILIISHRKKKSLEDYFDRDPELETYLKENHKENLLEKIKPPKANVSFIRQQEMKGSGDALLLAESFVGNSPFILSYPDDIVLNSSSSLSAQLMNIYHTTQKSILACEQYNGDVSRFGVINPGNFLSENLCTVNNIIEKPTKGTEPSKIISIGRYLLTADIFPILKECYLSYSGQGEFILTDALQVLAKQDSLLSYTYTGHRLDVGEPESYIRSLLYIIKNTPEYQYLLEEL